MAVSERSLVFLILSYPDLQYFGKRKYGKCVSYEAFEGAEYEIPANEFEKVLHSYFQVNREQLSANTIYDMDRQIYRYRPRGLYDSEVPYGPYPEVVAYEEQEDGTIKLYIEAVWERKMSDCAIASELVVRPFEDGSFQYVSNRVVSGIGNLGSPWYTPRLTEDEWSNIYGKKSGGEKNEISD